MKARLLGLVLCLCVGGSLTGADWPQWRGPDRSGVSKETGLLKSWPKEGPKLVWTFKNAGIGFSAPTVADGVLYVLGTRGEEEVVLALDANKGTELWVAKIGPIFTFKSNVWGDGPRGSATVDGERVYALGGQGDLVCLSTKDKGKELWRKNLIKDFGGEMMTEWGYSESPLVDGDALVCTPGGDKGTVVALDKKTGKLLWQSAELKHKAPYSSIVVAEIHGVRQYVQNSYVDDTVGGFINGIQAKDGKLLWSMPIFKGHSYAIAPTPIVKGNQVYITSGYGGGCHCFEISKEFKAKDLYSKRNQKAVKNTHGGVVLIGDHVYGHSEDIGWMCQEFMKGEVAWNDRDSLPCASGAITAAEGLLYCYTDAGEMALLQATPKEYSEVSRFSIPEKSQIPKMRDTSRQSKIWTHPVIANGRLLLRDHELIFCYDIKK